MTTLDRHVLQRTKRCIHCGNEFGPDPKYPGNFKRAKVCGMVCLHARKKYNPERAKAAFWSRVNMQGENGCWLYMGARDKWGYGDVAFLRKHVQAHRLSWKLLRGEPGAMDVLHSCNNPPCCNPEHLYLGTDADNAADRIKAGTVLRGEQLYNAKLTADKVREIRALKGKMTQKAIAAQYGLNMCYVSQLQRGQAWKHIK